MFSLFWCPLLAMNESRNSLLECVQPFPAYRLGSYPTDNMISAIIIISDHTIYFKKHHSFVIIFITLFLKLVFLAQIIVISTDLVDRRAETPIGQHLPPIAFVSLI